jgi:hypothetical protein
LSVLAFSHNSRAENISDQEIQQRLAKEIEVLELSDKYFSSTADYDNSYVLIDGRIYLSCGKGTDSGHFE